MSHDDEHSPDRLDLLDLSTNRITPVYEVTGSGYKGKVSNYIRNATISPTGKYVLIGIMKNTYDIYRNDIEKNKLVICENKEGMYLPIIEHFINQDFLINHPEDDTIKRENNRKIKTISLPKYNPVFLQFNRAENQFFIIDRSLGNLLVFRIDDKYLTRISELNNNIVQSAQWIDDTNLLLQTFSPSTTYHYFNTATNILSEEFIKNDSDDDFISFCLLKKIIPNHAQYNKRGNYYLIISLNAMNIPDFKTPIFQIYKRFTPSYIQSLSFIDQLFLSICVENHGCPVDDPVMHQHYFSFITEQFDPVRRTLFLSEKEKSKIKDFIKEEWNGVKDFFHRHSPRKFGKVGLL